MSMNLVVPDGIGPPYPGCRPDALPLSYGTSVWNSVTILSPYAPIMVSSAKMETIPPTTHLLLSLFVANSTAKISLPSIRTLNATVLSGTTGVVVTT